MELEMVRLMAAIFISIAVIIIIAIRIYQAKKNNEGKQEAREFLEGFSNTLYKKIIKIISEERDAFDYDNIEDTEEAVLKIIYESCWEYIEAYKTSGENSDKLTKLVLSVMNKEFVYCFIDDLLDRFNIDDLIREKYAVVHLNEEFIEKVENEDKELQERFSDEELYNTDEIDKYNDLELADAGVAYTVDENGNTVEFEKPADVEDPDLDTERDESVEVIGEDGLTDSERAAGVHFNRAGRKVDKRGRFTK